MPENNRIILKKSRIEGISPTPSDLVPGEIAINTVSGTVYSVDESGKIFIVGNRIPTVFSAKTINTQDGTIVFNTLNETMAIRGSYGCRTQANPATNTIDVIADSVDAIKLGGQLPNFYAEATHLHDERYAPQTKIEAASLEGNNWYRIAVADSVASLTRAAATFNVSTSSHYVRFNAIGQSTNNSSINILSGYRTKPLEQGQALSEIRIVTAASNKVALEVYLSAEIATQMTISMQNDVTNHNGWTLIEPVAVANDLATGLIKLVGISIADPYGYDTSAEIREKGQRVFSPTNKPNWSDVLNKPETLPPSDHRHDNLYYTEAEIDAKFNAILDGASEQLNSFKELSDALLANGDAIGALNDAIALKANKAGDTFTGDVVFETGLGVNVEQKIRFDVANATNGWAMSQRADGYLFFQMQISAGAWQTQAYFNADGTLFVKGNNPVWHKGNDGADSGLDADLLDGQHGSFYQNASNIITGTLAVARLTGTYDIGITGTAKTALDANNAVKLNNQLPSYYLNADNINAGVLSPDRLSGSYNIAVTGNAGSADKLKTPRNIALAGDVVGSIGFDGSGDVSMTTTIANDSHTHDGRYYTEAESDLRYGAVAQSGATHSLISKDTSGIISPPSDYNCGFYNELKKGADVGFISSPKAIGAQDAVDVAVITVAPCNGVEGVGNSQLLFKQGALYLRYGALSTGWNDLERVFTTAFMPTASDMGAIPADVGTEDASEAWFNLPFLADNPDKTGHSILKQATSKIRFQPKNGQLQVANLKCDDSLSVSGNSVFHDGNRPTVDQVTGTVDFGTF